MMNSRDRLKLERKVERWLAAGGVQAFFLAHERSERIKQEVKKLLEPVSSEMAQPMDF